MVLTGPQQAQLQEAIQDAFTSNELQQMVQRCLEVKLSHVTRDNVEFPTQVFDLIEWSQRHGVLAQLVDCVFKYRPENELVNLVHTSVHSGQFNVADMQAQLDAIAAVLVQSPRFALGSLLDFEQRTDRIQRSLTLSLKVNDLWSRLLAPEVIGEILFMAGEDLLIGQETFPTQFQMGVQTLEDLGRSAQFASVFLQGEVGQLIHHLDAIVPVLASRITWDNGSESAKPVQVDSWQMSRILSALDFLHINYVTDAYQVVVYTLWILSADELHKAILGRWFGDLSRGTNYEVEIAHDCNTNRDLLRDPRLGRHFPHLVSFSYRICR